MGCGQRLPEAVRAIPARFDAAELERRGSAGSRRPWTGPPTHSRRPPCFGRRWGPCSPTRCSPSGAARTPGPTAWNRKRSRRGVPLGVLMACGTRSRRCCCRPSLSRPPVGDPDDGRFDADAHRGRPRARADELRHPRRPVRAPALRAAARPGPARSPAEYLRRRRELGSAEVNRRFLTRPARAAFCVDTGFRPQGLTRPGELAALAGLGPGQAGWWFGWSRSPRQLAGGGVEPGEFAAPSPPRSRRRHVSSAPSA